PGTYPSISTGFDCCEPEARARPPRAHGLQVLARAGRILKATWAGFWRHGMSTAANSGARIKRVEVTDERITAHLADGRVISVPLACHGGLPPPPRPRARTL